VKHGIFVPPFDELADPRVVADLAVTAEDNGWDGFFVWDHITYRAPVVALADPWITLSAIAAATEQLRIGAMVTPLARRRPVVVARQTTSLDLLSNGRLVVGVGLGGDNSREFSATGEETDDRARANALDEALDVLKAAWSGEPVTHHGERYVVDDLTFAPTPIQRPHPPVWVAVRGTKPRPIRRAARWQGVFPIELRDPDHLAEVVASVDEARGSKDPAYDVAAEGAAGDDPRPWQAAGATWWLTSFTITTNQLDHVRAVIADGPAR
jgi:alkanesulfonate monooxygenase SsuD/methylene tetrahydromethanopterin reductase-like flavin-dependent oxidoreductase (luciferase family)